MKREADLLVDHAERAVTAARSELLGTLQQIRHRIDPRVIAAEAAERLVGRANFALSTAAAVMKDRPAVSVSSAAAFAAAVALRLWLAKSKSDDDAT